MAFLTLAAFSVAAGILILLIFKVTSNQGALAAARRRVRAHLLAMRLFADDPAVLLRSEGRLIAWNLRYMALLVPPFLAVAVPLFFAWDHLDALWGRAPLGPGDAVVLTARVAGDTSGVQLIVPEWLAVETPAVHTVAQGEVSWRLGVRQAGSGDVLVKAGGAILVHKIEARRGWHYLRERTTSAGPVEWVEARYPRAEVPLLGISFHWAVWFTLISTVAALALRRRLRVTL